MNKSRLIRVLSAIIALPGMLWLLIGVFTLGDVDFGLGPYFLGYACMCPLLLFGATSGDYIFFKVGEMNVAKDE